MKNDEKRAQIEIVCQNTDEKVRSLDVKAIIILEKILEDESQTNPRLYAISVESLDTRHMNA